MSAKKASQQTNNESRIKEIPRKKLTKVTQSTTTITSVSHSHHNTGSSSSSKNINNNSNNNNDDDEAHRPGSKRVG